MFSGCHVGCGDGSLAARQLAAEKERPCSDIYQRTHREFPVVIDHHVGSTRRQLLRVSAKDLAADGQNTRIVSISTDHSVSVCLSVSICLFV